VQHAGNALLALLTRYLENYWTEFHQTYSIDAFSDKDECIGGMFGVKRSKVKVAA